MSRSKKIILTLGILFSLGASLYFYLDHMRKEINTAVEPMIREIVASNWNPTVIDRYSTAQFKQWRQENSEKYESMLTNIRTLGLIKNYKGVERFSYQKTADAEWAAAGVLIDFEQVPMMMSLTLLKSGDQWLIQSFDLDAVKPNRTST